MPGGWGVQMDPSQWSAYYGYGQGYEAYAYGATQDPSIYTYGAYAGYAQYPQQVSLHTRPMKENDIFGLLMHIGCLIFRLKVLKTCQQCLCLWRNCMTPWQCLMSISKLLSFFFYLEVNDTLKIM